MKTLYIYDKHVLVIWSSVCVCVFVCVSVMQNDLNNNKVSVRDWCKRVGS